MIDAVARGRWHHDVIDNMYIHAQIFIGERIGVSELLLAQIFFVIERYIEVVHVLYRFVKLYIEIWPLYFRRLILTCGV